MSDIVEKMKKFKLRRDLAIDFCGYKLFRIEAVCDIEKQDVKAGDLGGYVEKEENLDGDAWVYGNAQVYGDKIERRADVCNITNQQYNITITPLHIKIGCQYHAKKAWFNFTDKEIEKMDGQHAVDWWKVWKPILQQICEQK